MAKFKIVCNGKILGISRRFNGADGVPDEYETDDPKEIFMLRRCVSAMEVGNTDEVQAPEAKNVSKAEIKAAKKNAPRLADEAAAKLQAVRANVEDMAKTSYYKDFATLAKRFSINVHGMKKEEAVEQVMRAINEESTGS